MKRWVVFSLLFACTSSAGPRQRAGAPSPISDAAAPSPDASAPPSSDAPAPPSDTSTPLRDTAASSPDTAAPTPDTAAPSPDTTGTTPDTAAPSPGNLASLVDNEWVELPSRVLPAAGITGAYQSRGWCTLRFVPGRDTLVFYEGFREASRGNYCIYANALYEVDPRAGDIRQRSLSNWFCDDSGGYRRLPNLPDTPVDRHTYAQFAYAPTTGSLYMIGGAAARFPMADHPFDFWRFPLDGGAWQKMPESYPGAEQDRAASAGAYTANLLFHPPSNSLVYFKSARVIHRFALASGAWTTLRDPPGHATVGDVGAHGLWDAKRDRFAFYGNNWHPQDQGSNELVFFDVAGGRWEERTVPPPPAGPPPKSYASLEYDSRHDVYLLHAGWRQNDTWVFDPTAESWRRIVTRSAPPPGGTGTYVAYAAAHDALVRVDEGGPRLFAFRYRP